MELTETHKIHGGCYCGNITFECHTQNDPKTFKPRACDCDFCKKHGAAYISDPNGKLIFHVKESQWLHKFKQPHSDQLAEFLICFHCGVLSGVIYRDKNNTIGAINGLAVEGVSFDEKVSVSPKKLSAKEKVERWRQNWFSQVRVLVNQTFISPL